MKKFNILLITAIIAFSALFTTAQTNNRAEMWDKEIDSLTEIDLKQTPPKDAVLFVGSSSIRMWKNLRQSFPQLNVINRGFGGSQLKDVNFYFDRIVAPYNPKIIVLYAGENDINDKFSPESILEDYKTFAKLTRAKFPKVKLIFVALKPSPSRWKLAENFKKTNELIKAETNKDKRAFFADVWNPMLAADGEPKKDIFMGDKLHMNEKGYAIWREVLDKFLK